MSDRDELRTQALDLRRRHADYAEIGRRLEVSAEEARLLVIEAVEQIGEVFVVDDASKAVEIARIEELSAVAYRSARAGDDRAMATWLRLRDRYDKLVAPSEPASQTNEIDDLIAKLSAPLGNPETAGTSDAG